MPGADQNYGIDSKYVSMYLLALIGIENIWLALISIDWHLDW